MRERDRSAFSQFDFLGLYDPRMRPDTYSCEGCSDWDDINGCWAGNDTIVTCERMGEEPHYIDPDMHDDDEDDWIRASDVEPEE